MQNAHVYQPLLNDLQNLLATDTEYIEEDCEAIKRRELLGYSVPFARAKVPQTEIIYDCQFQVDGDRVETMNAICDCKHSHKLYGKEYEIIPKFYGLLPIGLNEGDNLEERVQEALTELELQVPFPIVISWCDMLRKTLNQRKQNSFPKISAQPPSTNKKQKTQFKAMVKPNKKPVEKKEKSKLALSKPEQPIKKVVKEEDKKPLSNSTPNAGSGMEEYKRRNKLKIEEHREKKAKEKEMEEIRQNQVDAIRQLLLRFREAEISKYELPLFGIAPGNPQEKEIVAKINVAHGLINIHLTPSHKGKALTDIINQLFPQDGKYSMVVISSEGMHVLEEDRFLREINLDEFKIILIPKREPRFP